MSLKVKDLSSERGRAMPRRCSVTEVTHSPSQQVEERPAVRVRVRQGSARSGGGCLDSSVLVFSDAAADPMF